MVEQGQGLEWMEPTARRQLQEPELEDVVRFAYDHAPAVRERMDQAGIAPQDVRTMGDLGKMPIVRKDDIIMV